MIDGADHPRVDPEPPETLQVIARFGQLDLFGGSLNALHAIALDSLGDIYVGENFDARRFQRFLHKGLGMPVPGAILRRPGADSRAFVREPARASILKNLGAPRPGWNTATTSRLCVLSTTRNPSNP